MNSIRICILTSLCLVGFVSIVSTGCSGQPDSTAIEVEPGGNGKLSGENTRDGILLDIGLATFLVPEGWIPFTSDGNTNAGLMLKDEKPDNMTRMVTVEIGTPKTTTVSESAASFTATFDGTVVQEVTLDGETGYLSAMPPVEGQMTPRQCVTVHHNGQLIFIIAATKDLHANDVLTGVMSAWKWKEAESE